MGKKFTDETAVERAGGRFKLASLLEKRYKELVFGSRPLVDVDSDDPLETLMAEVVEDKIELVPEAEAVSAAAAALLGDSGPAPKAAKSAFIEDTSDSDEDEEENEKEEEDLDEEDE